MKVIHSLWINLWTMQALEHVFDSRDCYYSVTVAWIVCYPKLPAFCFTSHMTLSPAAAAAIAAAPVVWVAHHKNKLGSDARVQRNLFAYRVAMVMTGGRNVCPACDRPTDLACGDVERDRTIGGMHDDDGNQFYAAGWTVTVCKRCNQDRAALQSVGSDWPNVAAYVADVLEASAKVTMPTVREAREWWNSRTPAPDAYTSRYAG